MWSGSLQKTDHQILYLWSRLSGPVGYLDNLLEYFTSCYLIFTARIRRIGEGNIFSLFTLGGWGVPHLSSEVGGYPISGPGGGVPRPGLDVWEGGTPSQV